MADQKKCAHPSCDCIATGGEKYCSAYCQGSAGTTEIACGCGHSECSGASVTSGA